jgi:hypothetical protein
MSNFKISCIYDTAIKATHPYSTHDSQFPQLKTKCKMREFERI